MHGIWSVAKIFSVLCVCVSCVSVYCDALLVCCKDWMGQGGCRLPGTWCFVCCNVFAEYVVFSVFVFLCLYGVHLGVLQRLGGTRRVAVARWHLIRKSNCVPASAPAPFCPVFVIGVQLRKMIEDAESDESDNFQQFLYFGFAACGKSSI